MNHRKTSNWSAVLIAVMATAQGCASNSPSRPAPLETTLIAAQPAPTPPPAEPKSKPADQVAVASDTAPPTAAKTSVPVPTPAPSPAPINIPSDSQVIARLHGEPIRMDRIMPILIEGYGLNILLNIVQLEATKQEAAREGISVTPDEIKTEFNNTLAKPFADADKSDYDRLLVQLLEKQHISRAEFDLLIETNTYLRKLAVRAIKDKITDDILREQFGQMYGEKVQIRHIELANMQEVLEVKRLLDAGQPFEEVARTKSHNQRTAPLGGEFKPFTYNNEEYDKAFRDAAFTLPVGSVSDPISVSGTYQIIKVEKKIPPVAVKFEDVKDAVREDVMDRATTAAIVQLRAAIAENARKELIVDLKVLKDQYEAKLQQVDGSIKSTNQVRDEFERKRQEILKKAATQPSATQPGNPGAPETAIQATPVSPAPGVARPPATQSGTPNGSGIPDLPIVLPQPTDNK